MSARRAALGVLSSFVAAMVNAGEIAVLARYCHREPTDGQLRALLELAGSTR